MTVTATPQLTPAVGTGKPITVTIPAGGASLVRWNLQRARQRGYTQMDRPRTLGRRQGQRHGDREPAGRPGRAGRGLGREPLACRRRQSPTIAAPAGALPGGWVDVALSDTLAPGLEGVRRYMTYYPYNCFEQQLSRLVAIGDKGAWTGAGGGDPDLSR